MLHDVRVGASRNQKLDGTRYIWRPVDECLLIMETLWYIALLFLSHNSNEHTEVVRTWRFIEFA